ncbi:hypothetical protein DICVIV_01517 [Dictyocaulus viviparus]|uniref:Uncharacterized protein n=1 Tax=Dictyocaulus viviparus TaxID=29172 RepID=A0A0D8Y6G7_DICVI|nr:hypothetical protein DICVIV_01517 [Dictyocaulus viviparus]
MLFAIIFILLVNKYTPNVNNVICWFDNPICSELYCDESCGIRKCINGLCVCAYCNLSRYGIDFP